MRCSSLGLTNSQKRSVKRLLYLFLVKSQTIFGLFQLVLSLLAWLAIIITLEAINTNTFKGACTDKSTTNATKEDLTALCIQQYTREVFSHLFHRNFALINVGTLLLIWLLYSLYVTPRIRHVVEARSHSAESRPSYAVSLHSAYSLQVFLRLCFLIVTLCVLLYYQPLRLPLRFECVSQNVLSCRDVFRREKSVVVTLSLLTNVVLLFFALVEFIWILSRITTTYSSIYPVDAEETLENGCWCLCNVPVDKRFASVYLKITPREVNMLKSFLHDANQRILQGTEYIEGLSPSEKLKLDDCFTEPVLKECITDENRSFGTSWSEHSFDSHDHCAKKTTKRFLQNLENIFLCMSEDTEEQPRRILITGETGMGKSTIALKLARNVAHAQTIKQEDRENKQSFKMVFLVDTKFFQITESICILELLSRSRFGNEIPGEVFEYMMAHPKEILILIESVEKLQHQRPTGTDVDCVNALDEKLPVSTLCAKLVSGELVEGATVILITRSEENVKNITFDRKIEVVGFTTEKIKSYVKNFFEDCSLLVQEASIGRLANSSVLTVCCNPQNCMLMCSYLKRLAPDEMVVPTTVTDLYTEVLTILSKSLSNETKPDPAEEISTPSPLRDTRRSQYAGDDKPDISSIKEKSFEQTLGECNGQPTDCNRVLERLSAASLGSIEQGPGNFQLSKDECLKLEEAGILQRASSEDNPGCASLFYFRLQTLKDFLAARQVLSSNTEDKFIKKLVQANGRFADSKWDQVRLFVCGLLAQENPQKHRGIIEDLIKNLEQDNRNAPSRKCLLRTVKCVAEFRHPELARDTATKLIPNLDLRGLDMTPIDMSAIADVLLHASYHSLMNLDISYNEIGEIGAHRVAELLEMGTGPSEMLQLNGNGIGNDGMKKVFLALNRPGCSLKSLKAAKNCIDGVAVGTLASVTETPTCTLEELDLSENDVGTQGAKFIAEMLQNRDCRVKKLNLSSNCIGDEGARGIANAATFSGCKRLRMLNLGWNGISSSGTEDLTSALNLDASRVPQEIDLSGSAFNEPAVATLSQLIESPDCGVRSLGLNWCGLGDAAMDRLSMALGSTYCGVTHLSLAQNSISPVGAKRIAETLCSPSSCSVSVLNLGGNKLEDEGAKNLVDVLSHPSCNVETLDLSRNNISGAGTVCIAQALRKRNHIENLNLHGNQINAEGARQLFGAIRVEKCKLVRLLLGANLIDLSGIAKLLHTFRSTHCKLELLDLSENEISGEVFLNEFAPQLGQLALANDAGAATATKDRAIFVFQMNGRKRKIKYQA